MSKISSIFTAQEDPSQEVPEPIESPEPPFTQRLYEAALVLEELRWQTHVLERDIGTASDQLKLHEWDSEDDNDPQERARLRVKLFFLKKELSKLGEQTKGARRRYMEETEREITP